MDTPHKDSPDTIKQASQSTQSNPDLNRDGYVSAREAINALDRDEEVRLLTKDELVAHTVHEQLKKEADYFIFRIKKSRLMLYIGLLVSVLWLIPLTMFLNK